MRHRRLALDGHRLTVALAVIVSFGCHRSTSLAVRPFVAVPYDGYGTDKFEGGSGLLGTELLRQAQGRGWRAVASYHSRRRRACTLRTR